MGVFALELARFRWDRELQIIQADVRLAVQGTAVIDEALCVDVGLPALAASLHGDVEPDRTGPPEEWHSKPFFVCGCGDPECRAYLFRVQHQPDQGTVVLAEVEERGEGRYRVLEEFEVEAAVYRTAVVQALRSFLAFAEGLEGYRPLYAGTLARIRETLDE